MVETMNQSSDHVSPRLIQRSNRHLPLIESGQAEIISGNVTIQNKSVSKHVSGKASTDKLNAISQASSI